MHEAGHLLLSMPDKEWQQLLSDWANRTGMVIAFEYAEALRALKSLVHAV